MSFLWLFCKTASGSADTVDCELEQTHRPPPSVTVCPAWPASALLWLIPPPNCSSLPKCFWACKSSRAGCPQGGLPLHEQPGYKPNLVETKLVVCIIFPSLRCAEVQPSLRIPSLSALPSPETQLQQLER